MKRILAGALVGVLVVVALNEIGSRLSGSDRTEIGDSYAVMIPIALILGAIIGAMRNSARSGTNQPEPPPASDQAGGAAVDAELAKRPPGDAHG